MARNSLLCADVPLRNYSLTHTHCAVPKIIHFHERYLKIHRCILQKSESDEVNVIGNSNFYELYKIMRVVAIQYQQLWPIRSYTTQKRFQKP